VNCSILKTITNFTMYTAGLHIIVQGGNNQKKCILHPVSFCVLLGQNTEPPSLLDNINGVDRVTNLMSIESIRPCRQHQEFSY